MEFLEEWNLFFGFLFSLWTIIIILIGIFSENKYNVINRIKKRYAFFKNKNAKIDMKFRYETISDFNNIKKSLLEQFNKPDVKRNTDERLDFTSDIFSVTLILEPDKTAFIHFERMGSGLKYLKEKINVVLRSLGNLSKEQRFSNLLACDLDIILPYTWTYVKINKPRGFNIKNYIIDLDDDEFKSNIKIMMDNKISFRFKGIDEIYQIIQKVL